MPVGRINYKGSLPVGRTNPTALGTAATRLAAKAGLGASSAKRPNPAAQRRQDELAAEAFGFKRVNKASPASKGRQNAKVVTPATKKTVVAKR